MRNILTTTFSNILFNTAIAGLLTAVGFGGSFWNNLVIAQCIGLSIYAANASVMCYLTDKRWRWAPSLGQPPSRCDKSELVGAS